MIYLKIFIIIILIVIIISFLKQENFNVISSDTLDFNIRRKGSKSIEINWEKTNYNITKYIIKLYINNDGPFIEIKDINTSDININFILNDIKLNTVYKIGIASINNQNVQSAYKIKEFMINSYDDNLSVNYKKNFNKNRIVCNPDGQHINVINDNDCKLFDKEQYIQANDIDSDTFFNENNYNNLMRDLNKTNSLKLSFEDSKLNNNEYKLNIEKW